MQKRSQNKPKVQTRHQQQKQQNWERRVLIEIVDSPPPPQQRRLAPQPLGQQAFIVLDSDSSSSASPGDMQVEASHDSASTLSFPRPHRMLCCQGYTSHFAAALVQVAPLAANADDGDMAAEEPVEERAEEASSGEPSSEEQSEEPSEEASEEPAMSGEADPEEPEEEEEEAAEEPQVIALTGRFTLGHSELARLIEQRGMTYACNVTKQTTMLVRGGDQECQKWRAAQRYGVPVEGPARLAKLLGLDAI